MTRTHFILLLLAALVIGILALVMHQRDTDREFIETGQLLYPDLEMRLDDIGTITLLAPEGVEINVVGDDSGWGVRERGGYPANVNELRRILRELSDLRTIEEKTSQPAKYPRLGVQDPREPGATGYEIRLMDANGTTLVDLIVGDRAPTGGYVRKQDESRSWQVSHHIHLPDRIQDMLNKELLRIAPAEITRIQRLPVAGDAYTVERDPEGGWILDPAVSTGGRIMDRELDRLAAALGHLDLSDVMTPDESPLTGDADADVTRYTLRSGRVIEARVLEQEEDRYLGLALTGGAESGTPGQVDELQNRFEGWVFRIPVFAATSLTLPLSAVIEPPAEPAPGHGDDVETTEDAAVPQTAPREDSGQPN